MLVLKKNPSNQQSATLLKTRNALICSAAPKGLNNQRRQLKCMMTKLFIWFRKTTSQHLTKSRTLSRKQEYNCPQSRDTLITNYMTPVPQLETGKPNKLLIKPAQLWKKKNRWNHDDFVAEKRKVWRMRGTAHDLKHTTPSFKHGGGSVMAWPRMASRGTGPLVYWWCEVFWSVQTCTICSGSAKSCQTVWTAPSY